VAVNGPALAAVAAGSLLVYAALEGKTVLGAIQAVIQGKAPATGAASGAIPIASDIAGAASAAAGSLTLGDTGASSPSAAQNQATAKMLAISMGYSSWTAGQQWDDWVSLWNEESGWSITAANPISDARGIAQNINGYGPGYLEGNAQSQITWGINYIAGRYGNPSAAWAFETSHTPNWY
jgi:hypothetical protein